MKVSEIVKSYGGEHRIVKVRQARQTRRRADLLSCLRKTAQEFGDQSLGVTGEDDEQQQAVQGLIHAINRLHGVLKHNN